MKTETKKWSYQGVDVIYDPKWGCWRRDPLPTPEWIKEFYEKKYFQEVKAGWDEIQNEDLEYLERVFEDKQLNLIELLRKDSGNSMVDIGCGNGMLLSYFQRKGWNVLGIEPGPLSEVAQKKYGIKCVTGFVEDFIKQNQSTFDVVHLGDVLEHVLDPYGILATAKSLLKTEGIFCMDHGLDFNPFQLTAVDYLGLPPWWIVPEHITYWTHEQTEAALRKAGFRILQKESDFPIDMFLLMGINYVKDPKRGKEAHKMRVSLETALSKGGRDDLRRKLLKQFASVGIGRSIRYYCSRES